MPHQLTKLGAGPCGWDGYDKDNNGFLVDICKMSPEGLVADCEGLIKVVEQGDLDPLQAIDDIWYASQQIEVFRRIVSHYRRQLVYTYVNETGRGSMVELGRRFGVAKQRISELASEAKEERLARVTGESIVKEVTS